MVPFNLLGEILGWILPGDNDLYLDNIVLARKKQHTTQAVVGKDDQWTLLLIKTNLLSVGWPLSVSTWLVDWWS